MHMGIEEMEENVYSQQTFKHRVESSTLYEAIRPTTFEEYVGQDHLLNQQNGSIFTFIKLGYLPSMIFLGPPGVGKTTLASVISYECKLPFIELSATTLTTGELKQIAMMHEEQIVVFIDEIHRLTKVQQDWLLPYVENGKMVLIGATTSHPSKRIRHAILSRCHDLILELAHGDSRIAINLVELISNNYSQTDDGRISLKNHDLKRLFSNLTDSSSEGVIKNQEVFMNFMNELCHGCTSSHHSKLFYQNPLEFFYDDFKSKEADEEYIYQMQVSDDSDVENGDIYSDCESDGLADVEGISDASDYHLVAALYYLNVLLSQGESPTAIFRHLILFTIKYTDCENSTLRKLISFKNGIAYRNDGHSVTALSNCVEWLMYRQRKMHGKQLSLILNYMMNYFKNQEALDRTNEINVDDLEISFDDNEVKQLEVYPQFERSEESQIKGFEVTFESSIDES
ncbi:DNA-dependent ATPase MGS1 [Candida tropicalis]